GVLVGQPRPGLHLLGAGEPSELAHLALGPAGTLAMQRLEQRWARHDVAIDERRHLVGHLVRAGHDLSSSVPSARRANSMSVGTVSMSSVPDESGPTSASAMPPMSAAATTCGFCGASSPDATPSAI